jgi:ABC-2 type transport system ATP-binding protein
LNKRERTTVFLTMHYMEEADYLSHMVAIIDHGKILAVNEPRNIKDMIEGDVILVGCSDLGPLVEELGRQSWVKGVEARGSELGIYVDHSKKKIPEIIMTAERLGLSVGSVLLRKPLTNPLSRTFTPLHRQKD